MMRNLLITISLHAALLLTPAAQAQELNGRVVHISDGDTLIIETHSGQDHDIRFAGIDTPESDQPYGGRAEQALRQFLQDDRVTVEVLDRDQYGRLIGHVYADGQWVNRAMVCHGHAWVYRRYAERQALYECEERARAKQAGLWALPADQRIPPWDWRQGERSASGVTTQDLKDAVKSWF